MLKIKGNKKNKTNNKVKVLLLFFLILSAFNFKPANAAFIDPGWGTRGAGKAGAFLATADDASSIMWNPAALSQVFMREGVFSYHKPYAGLEGIEMYMGYGAVVIPVYGIANFGFASSIFNFSDLYKETSYQLSVAKELSEIIPNLEPLRLAVGMNFKYLYHEYTWDDEIKALGDPITEKDGVGAFTIDIGILFQPVYEVPIGITVKNVIPADIGLVSEDIVPLEAGLGVAYRLGGFKGFEEITPEIKIGYRDQEYGNKINFAIGLEIWLALHTLGLRAGYNSNEITFGTSFEKYFGHIGFRIDYAVSLSTVIRDNMGSHRVSTSIKF